MKKLIIGLVLLASMSSFAAPDKLNCFVTVDAEEKIMPVDFSKITADQYGFKFATLAEKGNIEYVLIKHKDNKKLELTKGKDNGNGSVRALMTIYGNSFNIQDVEDQISIMCE